MTISAIDHQVTRLVVDVPTNFEDFRKAFDDAVPAMDLDALGAIIATGDLDAVRNYTSEQARHNFLIFATIDASPMMRLAGHPSRAVTYLMGNNMIAETMFRHDPGILLYAPLRVAVYEDRHGGTHFSIDQPSTRFASFGDPAITEVGHDLDRKLAELLTVLDLPVPSELQP